MMLQCLRSICLAGGPARVRDALEAVRPGAPESGCRRRDRSLRLGRFGQVILVLPVPVQQQFTRTLPIALHTCKHGRISTHLPFDTHANTYARIKSFVIFILPVFIYAPI